MKIETHIPHKGLIAWLKKNGQGKVQAIGLHPGFCNNQGDPCSKYDCILTDEWHRVDGGGHRCITEGNGGELLRQLKQIEPCPGTDHECYGK